MIRALSSALQGLLRAKEDFGQSVERVAKGDISAEALIETKVNALNVRVQAKSLQTIAEEEEKLIDYLA